MAKMTKKADAALDKKKGIKDGSKADQAMDKKNGVKDAKFPAKKGGGKSKKKGKK